MAKRAEQSIQGISRHDRDDGFIRDPISLDLGDILGSVDIDGIFKWPITAKATTT
jgi:hypothetical protein